MDVDVDGDEVEVRDVGSLDFRDSQNHGPYRCHRPSRCRSLILKLGGFSRRAPGERNDVQSSTFG